MIAGTSVAELWFEHFVFINKSQNIYSVYSFTIINSYFVQNMTQGYINFLLGNTFEHACLLFVYE